MGDAAQVVPMRAGRPTLLDEAVTARICDAVRLGNTRRCAAQAAGVSITALTTWLRRGRAGEEPYAAFAARLEKADADAEQSAVGVIRNAMPETWQAAAWWLERRHHRRWGRKQPEAAPPPDDGGKPKGLTDSQVEKRLAELRAQLLAGGEPANGEAKDDDGKRKEP